MASKSPLLLKTHLFVLIHAGSGSPFALRINMRQLSGSIALLGGVFALCVVGTLCFFRELEINRKLGERLLEMESREKLAITAALNRGVAATAPGASTSSPAAGGSTTASASSPASSAPTPASVAKAEPTELAAPAPASLSSVNARIGPITPVCDTETCDVRVALSPTQTGLAEGHLLLVLETEIPRIGAGNPTTQVRKRFYSYPGSEVRDDLDQEALLSLRRRPFRFARALHTNASFSFGKLLRPLAINVYIFDKENSLVLHERKPIELEE